MALYASLRDVAQAISLSASFSGRHGVLHQCRFELHCHTFRWVAEDLADSGGSFPIHAARAAPKAICNARGFFGALAFDGAGEGYRIWPVATVRYALMVVVMRVAVRRLPQLHDSLRRQHRKPPVQVSLWANVRAIPIARLNLASSCPRKNSSMAHCGQSGIGNGPL